MLDLIDKEVYQQFGISDFLIDALKNEQKSKQITTACLVIENSNNIHYQCQSKGIQYQLLLKMLLAIGLSEKDFHLVSFNQAQLEAYLKTQNAQTILNLGEGLSLTGQTVFDCHHPSDILNDKNLKREAWEVLKQLKVAIE